MLLENSPYPEDSRVLHEAEALVDAGHEVIVLAPRAPRQRRREHVGRVRVQRYLLPRGAKDMRGFLLEYLVAHVQLLVGAVREIIRGADVVHIHNPPDTLFVIGLLGRLMRRRYVFDHHDSAPELFEEKFGRSPVARLLRVAQCLSLRTASAVIVTNESQRLLALARAGRPLRALVVVRNGPPKRRLAPTADTRPGRLRDARLIYVGELEPQDGVLGLPELLTHPRLGAASLTIVGDGTLRPELEERARALAVRGRVHFTGWVAYEQVFRLLREADIAMDPSPCNALNHISTMTKVAEYLAAARPVVAFRLTETERTAGPAALYVQCGRLDDFARQVVRLAEDEELRGRLALAGLARASDLVYERSARILLDLYAGL